jgi:hypothetical protein
LLIRMPTRFLAPTGGHPVSATPWLESAPHSLDARRSLLIHAADTPLNETTELTIIPFRTQPAAPTHRKQLSIPILLPR